MTDTTFKLCPFCGGGDIDPSFSRGYSGGDTSKPVIAAGCWGCNATGPDILVPKEGNGYEQSTEAWNKRP